MCTSSILLTRLSEDGSSLIRGQGPRHNVDRLEVTAGADLDVAMSQLGRRRMMRKGMLGHSRECFKAWRHLKTKCDGIRCSRKARIRGV